MMDIGTESTSIYILHNFHPDIFDEIKYIVLNQQKRNLHFVDVQWLENAPCASYMVNLMLDR